MPSMRASHYCAMWNPDLNINGGWDNKDNIQMVYGDNVLATCHATKVGLVRICSKLCDTFGGLIHLQ